MAKYSGKSGASTRAVKFAVRQTRGDSSHGEVLTEGKSPIINVGGSPEIYLILKSLNISRYTSVSNHLEITLADGRVIELTNYDSEAGGDTRLFISPDGYRPDLALVDIGDNTLYAQCGPITEGEVKSLRVQPDARCRLNVIAIDGVVRPGGEILSLTALDDQLVVGPRAARKHRSAALRHGPEGIIKITA